MEIIKNMTYLVTALFIACYSYQLFYIIIAHFKKMPNYETDKLHRYAVLICARNEEAVIGQLIDSVKEQNYPVELIDVFVAADNCTDNTAEVAKNHGATVWERFDAKKIGKGYAMNFLLKKIPNEYDGYFVFDADNLLDKNFVLEMNKTFSQGYKIITSYRKSKNYGANWVSAGYSLWFLREAQYLNYPRMLLGTSCSASGTGFLFSKEILEKNGGWNFFLLTEDLEFTFHNVVNGERVGYCKNAIHYDEQPESFKQSWTQRMRWSKGYFQVLNKYKKDIIHKIFVDRDFSVFDLSMTIVPAFVFTIISALLNVSLIISEIIINGNFYFAAQSLGLWAFSTYFMLFVVGLIATIAEWRNIDAKNYQKVKYLFTFPFFMWTYFPIAMVSVFKNVKWEPIKHNHAITIDQIAKN